ncbi:MAG TPA: SDR family oxidoreductase [Kiritimatiellia bacterium]|nr:SDR family oxidoreductase [Kiritimatiellia bacterium]HMP33819.1 SDR family oxidoreductase [Kiritimatiellia bacterium]
MNESASPFKDQSVIITGGASGIGRASALRMAKAGAKVAVVDINEANIQSILAEIEHTCPGTTTLGIRTDVRFPDQVDAMAAQVNEAFGRIDILIHSAGVLRPPGSSPRILPQMETADCDALIDINLKGTFLCDRAVLQFMMAQRSGQILNIASTSGLKGIAFDAVYCASKFGVVGLTESLAEEVRPFGVRVHLLLPDAVATPLWDTNIAGAPAGSLQPDRVAHVIELMLGLPEDMILSNVVVAPFKTRRRKKKDATES